MLKSEADSFEDRAYLKKTASMILVLMDKTLLPFLLEQADVTYSLFLPE